MQLFRRIVWVLFAALITSGCCIEYSAAAADRPLTICVIGDSNTADTLFPGDTEWPYLMLGKLKSQYPRRTFTLHNGAIGGWTVSNYLNGSGAQDIHSLCLDHNPDIVLCMLGSNDAKKQSEWPYEPKLRSLIDVVTSHANADGTKPKLVLMQPPVGLNSEITGNATGPYTRAVSKARLVQFKDTVSALGKEYGLPVAAVWDDMAGKLGWTGDTNTENAFISDGIHLTRSGNDFVASKALRAIRAFLGTVGAIDEKPPSRPAYLRVKSLRWTRAKLSWGRSTDNSKGSVRYKIYDGDKQIKQTRKRSATIRGLPAGIHTFKVIAVDAAGNESKARARTLEWRPTKTTVDVRTPEYGEPALVRLRLFNSAGQPLSGRSVKLARSVDGKLFEMKSLDGGWYTANVTVPGNTRRKFRVRFAGDAALSSNETFVNAGAPRTSFYITPRARLKVAPKPSVARADSAVRITGTIAPKHTRATKVTLVCTRTSAIGRGATRSFDVTVTPGSGAWSYGNVTLPTGKWEIVAEHQDKSHAATKSSPRVVTVRESTTATQPLAYLSNVLQSYLALLRGLLL